MLRFGSISQATLLPPGDDWRPDNGRTLSSTRISPPQSPQQMVAVDGGADGVDSDAAGSSSSRSDNSSGVCVADELFCAREWEQRPYKAYVRQFVLRRTEMTALQPSASHGFTDREGKMVAGQQQAEAEGCLQEGLRRALIGEVGLRCAETFEPVPYSSYVYGCRMSSSMCVRLHRCTVVCFAVRI